MKITFYSNFMNHHQLPFCKAMIKLIGDEFTFVATEPIEADRLAMGYADMNSDYSFVLRTYDGEEYYKKALSLAEESDVIILGSAPNEYVDIRLKQNKLTFKYAERLFKKGIHRRFIPTTRKKINTEYIKYAKSNFYVLCSSAYTAYDLSLCGMKNNTYKWGYFPNVKKQNSDVLMKKKQHEKVKLLWAGRFIDWKCLEDAVYVAKRLKANGYSFSFNIIGTGKCEESIKILVNKHNLSDCISFLGPMPPEQVREYMEEANIYLFTSNFQEGWGAVLNEAMNSGCAIVASHAIGSVPYLLEHKKNGLIYKFGNKEDFFSKVKYLFDYPSKQEEYGKEAYETLVNTWNAEIAAERLINLSQLLLDGQNIQLYDDGPCSNTEIIKNNWFKLKRLK